MNNDDSNINLLMQKENNNILSKISLTSLGDSKRLRIDLKMIDDESNNEGSC
jgi:hypothetical protein